MWYWRQVSWNAYVLINTDTSERHAFQSYEALYSFCVKYGIDAQQD